MLYRRHEWEEQGSGIVEVMLSMPKVDMLIEMDHEGERRSHGLTPLFNWHGITSFIFCIAPPVYKL